MKLIEIAEKKMNMSRERIIDIACPGDLGPDYDKYEDGWKCGEKGECDKCWQQEVSKDEL